MIPAGRVTTYGSIAQALRRPAGVTARHFKAARARWVGQALALCPADIPWHRVINAQGRISVRKSGDGARIQRGLLEKEGVKFEKGERVDLLRYGWSPPGAPRQLKTRKLPSKAATRKPTR